MEDIRVVVCSGWKTHWNDVSITFPSGTLDERVGASDERVAASDKRVGPSNERVRDSDKREWQPVIRG